MLDLNRFPYFDDFDANKQFMKVLFNPGRAVQARELTQLQSILQHQVSKFGEHIFKEGSLVLPGSLFYDDLSKFVKFDANSANDFLVSSPQVLGKKLIAENGLQAVISHAHRANGFIYLYIKYLNSANDGVTNRFSRGQNLTLEGISSTLVTADVDGVVGTGTLFSITQGVIFTQQHFVQFPSQTIVVSPELSLANVSIGFNVKEQIVTSDQDESLLDNAQGSFNFTAPGADRYKIGLELATRDLESSINDDKYVELYRIEESQRIFKKENPEYAFLENILARRTFDESGDYTVRPYSAVIREHLRVQTNAGSNDGVYENGNESLMAVFVRPGKAYVKGYEVENMKTAIVPITKAREFATENAAVIRPLTQSHILIDTVRGGIDFNAFPEVSLYSELRTFADTSAPLLANKVGTARVRGMEYFDGNSASEETQYRLFLFDVKMNPGKNFNRDVKQVYLDNTDGTVDFSANIVPTFRPLTGSITYTSGSATATVNAGRIADELRIGDFIQSATFRFRVNAINLNNNTITVSPTPTVSQTLEFARIETQVRGEVTPLIQRMPNKGIRSFLNASAQTDATYEVKRVLRKPYDSLAGITFNRTVTEEIFQPANASNYFAFNGSTGAPVRLQQIVVSTSGSSVTVVGNPADISLGQVLILVSTIRKVNASANHKTKLDTSGSFTTTTLGETIADQILLGKADVYEIVSVKQSGAGFGAPYTTTGEVDITRNFVLENGQTPYYYGISSVRRVGPAPTAPIRVTFRYFRHTSGDYFSVDSYNDIDYKNIPTVRIAGSDYALRDCLDFRPRIDADGDFFGGESSQTEFITTDSDFIADYSYYLPRVDKIWLDTNGKLGVSVGKSSLFPQEPEAPSNTMTLFVIRQNPYVFDVKTDVSVIKIEHKRFTMRDIGKLETRIKNLEYYTTLSLLEREAASYQIKDENGFDRFKNGFVVDQFKGHGIGDVTAPGYRIGIDYNKYEARAISETLQRKLKLRTFSNMVVNNGIATLPYTERKLISVNVASRTENVNPFSVITYVGKIELDPPADIWKDTTRLPDIYLNVEGNYNNLLQESRTNGKFETVWGEWRDMWFGTPTSTTTRAGDFLNTVTDTEVQQDRSGTVYEIVERIDVETRNDVFVSSQIIPKMRDVNITFKARGLKPNTRVHVFFDGIRVTEHCHQSFGVRSNISSIRPVNELGEEFTTGFFDTTSPTNGSYYTNPVVLRPDFIDAEAFTGDITKVKENATYGLSRIFTGNLDAPSTAPGVSTAANYAFAFANMQAVFAAAGVSSPLITDNQGNLTGVFYYKAANFNLETGEKIFRISDDPVDGPNKETAAQTVFRASGELITIRNEIISTRNADLTQKTVSENRTINRQSSSSVFDPIYVPPVQVIQQPIYYPDYYGGDTSYPPTPQDPPTPTPPPPEPPPPEPQQGLINAVYNLAFGRQAEAGGLEYWNDRANQAGVTAADIAALQKPVDQRTVAELQAADRVSSLIGEIAAGANNETGGYFKSGVSADPVASASQNVINIISNPSLATDPLINRIVSNLSNVEINRTDLPLHAGNNSTCPPASIFGQVYDPLAQTFFIERDTFFTSADIYMQARDENVPLRVQLVRVVNGYPGTDVIPGSEVLIDPQRVAISDNATAATKVIFDYPIFLEAGQYAIVLLADSVNYKAWISRMGENDVTTGSLISAQPSLGSLFKSQNASTWTAEQFEDLKFSLYAALFESTAFTAEFSIDTDDILTGPFNLKDFDNDPIQLFNGSNRMRLYCKGHDLNPGSFFRLLAVNNIQFNTPIEPKNGPSTGFPLYGLNFEDIMGVDLEVVRSTEDYFEVTLPKEAIVTDPSGKIRFGKNTVRAYIGQNYDYIYPAVAAITPTRTQVFGSVITTDRNGNTDSVARDVAFNRDNEILGRTILNKFNEDIVLAGNKSFTFRMTGTSVDPALSPVIDIRKSGLIFIKNVINSPAVTDSLEEDFTKFITGGTDTITVTGNRIEIPSALSAVRTFVKTIRNGSTLELSTFGTITGTPIENIKTGYLTIKTVDLAGAFIELTETVLDGTYTGNQITLRVSDLFIDETAPVAGSAINKYISKKFDFVNPSRSVDVRLSVNRPADTDIELYYRASFVNEAVDLKDKPWTKYGLNAPIAQDSRMIDIERMIDTEEAFNSIQVKIVITSKTSVTPRFTDLRLIALA